MMFRMRVFRPSPFLRVWVVIFSISEWSEKLSGLPRA